MNLSSALKYSKSKHGQALVVRVNNIQVLESYHNGFPVNGIKDIESGSKSFSGVLLSKLIEDGLVSGYDQKVSSVVHEWQTASAQKEACTLRALLSLTSGLNAGTPGVPVTYEDAITRLMPLNDVGEFKYGPVPFSVFGLFVNRLVQPLGYSDPADYLQQRLPVVIHHWDYLSVNEPHLAGGAHITALNWAAFGELMRSSIPQELLQTVDPRYGITWWKSMSMTSYVPTPGGGYSAAGAFNQRLYIVPEESLVCARFGTDDGTWSDEEFIGRLLG